MAPAQGEVHRQVHSWRPCIYLPARTSGLRDFLAAFALPAPAQTTCIIPDSAGKCVPGLFHQGSPPTPFLAGEEKTDQWLEFLPVYLCFPGQVPGASWH